MNRILIIGTSGSGKSTLAKKISEKLHIAYYDLDEYYWLPNWQPRNLEDFQSQINTIIQQPQWIISGNYAKVRTEIWEKADSVIWLNYSFFRCLYQATKRSLHRILTKETCCNDNQENFRQSFLSKQSPLLWIMKSHWRYQKEYDELFCNKKPENKLLLKFNNPDIVVQWLTAL